MLPSSWIGCMLSSSRALSLRHGWKRGSHQGQGGEEENRGCEGRNAHLSSQDPIRWCHIRFTDNKEGGEEPELAHPGHERGAAFPAQLNHLQVASPTKRCQSFDMRNPRCLATKITTQPEHSAHSNEAFV